MRATIYSALLKKETLCINDENQLCIRLTFSIGYVNSFDCIFRLEDPIDIQRLKTLGRYIVKTPKNRISPNPQYQIFEGVVFQAVVVDNNVYGFVHPLSLSFLPLLTEDFQEIPSKDFLEAFELC